MSTAPAAAAGASVLGVTLVSYSTGETPAAAVASTGANSITVMAIGLVMIVLAFLAVAWGAKHPRR